MGEIKLSDDVFEQIKDFNHENLTKEQKSLIDKLIPDEELKQCYEENGLCNECKQPKHTYYWCRCNFQRNFKNWTSGNNNVDNFIQSKQLKSKRYYEILEWIEYDRFENIEYLAEGGFGTVYKAFWKDGPIKKWDSENNQWEREKTHGDHENYPVALKRLHNSQNITVEFLKEIELHLMVSDSDATIIKCYGVTKDPKTNDFIMVMEYANNGSLRQYIDKNFNSLNWNDKLYNLYFIAHGLNKIHEWGIIHHDFHCGNILNHRSYSKITDLGLCKPVNTTSQDSVYGVLPYIAPEVLRGKEYIQASDIYGFGIIAYELCTGFPPYHDISHDEFLAINICQGLRPKSNYKIPQLILDIIQQCWDADPFMRPKAEELYSLFENLYNKSNKVSAIYEENSTINKQIKEVDEINKELSSSTATSGVLSNTTHTSSTVASGVLSNTTHTSSTVASDALSYTKHTQAVYTSRLLKFKNLPKPRNDNSLEYLRI